MTVIFSYQRMELETTSGLVLSKGQKRLMTKYIIESDLRYVYSAIDKGYCGKDAFKEPRLYLEWDNTVTSDTVRLLNNYTKYAGYSGRKPRDS